MATYAELFDIANNNTLLDRMTAAVALGTGGAGLSGRRTASHVADWLRAIETLDPGSPKFEAYATRLASLGVKRDA